MIDVSKLPEGVVRSSCAECGQEVVLSSGSQLTLDKHPNAMLACVECWLKSNPESHKYTKIVATQEEKEEFYKTLPTDPTNIN